MFIELLLCVGSRSQVPRTQCRTRPSACALGISRRWVSKRLENSTWVIRAGIETHNRTSRWGSGIREHFPYEQTVKKGQVRDERRRSKLLQASPRRAKDHSWGTCGRKVLGLFGVGHLSEIHNKFDRAGSKTWEQRKSRVEKAGLKQKAVSHQESWSRKMIYSDVYLEKPLGAM